MNEFTRTPEDILHIRTRVTIEVMFGCGGPTDWLEIPVEKGEYGEWEQVGPATYRWHHGSEHWEVEVLDASEFLDLIPPDM